MKRELGRLERSFVVADGHPPFHIVGVLQLEHAPPPHHLQQALRVLQNRQPFLRARLLHEKGRYFLESLVDPHLPLHVLPRWNAGHWMLVTEVELGMRFEVSSGPLFRCTYLYDAARARGDIVLSLYHAIADAASASQLMHDLLGLCVSIADQASIPIHELAPAPPAEARFPPGFRGVRMSLSLPGYGIRQVADELAYRRAVRHKRVPPVRKQPARGRILSLQLGEDLFEALEQRARRERVTLNSLLNTALLLAVNRHLYAGQPVPMRTLTFANLRPYVRPALPAEELACYISMLRHTARVEGGADFWPLARSLHAKIDSSFRSGDKFLAAALAEPMMRMMTRSQSFRMSATALNYNGVIPVLPGYGEINVTGVHGFVSACDPGPEFSAQAQVFDSRLWLDFIYLEADLNREEAQAIVGEIRSILASAIVDPGT